MRLTHNRIRLPSMPALRAFEAAARLGNFTSAAHELAVTQGAVSRQVQELERQLSAELFHRQGPRIVLTDRGRLFAESTRNALESLRAAVAAAQPSHERNYLTLSMLPSVAAKWFAPRLGSFMEMHPNVELRIAAARQIVDFEIEDIDAAIRYGQGLWHGVNAVLLAEETVLPVCSHGYAARLKIKMPADLLRATLFYSDIEEDWPAWFRLAGVSPDLIPRGPKLGDDSAILQAAVDGQGIALGRSMLVAEDIRTGKLVAPFTCELPTLYKYWFVTPKKRPVTNNLKAVQLWIQKEFEVDHGNRHGGDQ